METKTKDINQEGDKNWEGDQHNKGDTNQEGGKHLEGNKNQEGDKKTRRGQKPRQKPRQKKHATYWDNKKSSKLLGQKKIKQPLGTTKSNGLKGVHKCPNGSI